MHKITFGTCRWTNKEHFPVRMYSPSIRGHEVAMTEGQWLLSKLPECSAPKNPHDSPEAHACSPYIPPTLYVSITFVMSLNDVMIICFPLSVGKALHMCRRAMPVCLHTHQHPHQLFSTAMHEPAPQFHIPNLQPVTLIQRITKTNKKAHGLKAQNHP